MKKGEEDPHMLSSTRKRDYLHAQKSIAKQLITKTLTTKRFYEKKISKSTLQKNLDRNLTRSKEI